MIQNITDNSDKKYMLSKGRTEVKYVCGLTLQERSKILVHFAFHFSNFDDRYLA